MLFIYFIFIVSLVLTCLEDKKILKNGMAIAFGLLITVFSLRYGYGNDYFSYRDSYVHIGKYISLIDAYSNQRMEIGWVFLCYLFKDFGFQSVIFVVTLFTNLTIYRLIKKRVPKGWYWMALFLYLSNPHLFLLNLSMIRQSIAVVFFALAIDALFDRKYVKMVLYVMLTISFHTSAVIVVPFVLMLLFRRYIRLELVSVFLLGAVIFLLYNAQYAEMLYTTILSNDVVGENYGNYLSLDGSERGSGYGVVLQLCMTIPIFLSYKSFSFDDKALALLFISYLFFIPLSFQMTLIKRLSLYFMFFGILILPMSFNICKYRVVVHSIIAASIVYNLYALSQFFVSPTYGKAFGEFHTILF